MHRRDFLRLATLGTGALAAGCVPTRPNRAASCPPPPISGLPYGPLRAPDANGIRLPVGFTSRIVATTNQEVGDTKYVWPPSPDGGACFRVRDNSGDYVYAANAEALAPMGGGVSAIRFARNGEIRDAYRILGGTSLNCAGGKTPWGTWLSGEEFDAGQIWECNPFQPSQGVARPALGLFAHEAAAVDPFHRHVYLTEDRPDGRFYRFAPTDWPSLASGRLEVARVTGENVEWVTVSDGPIGASKPRPAGTTAFNGGEGIWFSRGRVFFTTKGDNRVWRLTTRDQKLCIVYDDDTTPNAPLTGVDNVTVSRAGEVLIAEDGGNMEINVLRTGRVIGPLLQVVGQDGSEIAGPAFGPAGDRLYFSSQRALGTDGVAVGLGITYEVRGPFRRAHVRR
jgi:uncharacterized protein